LPLFCSFQSQARIPALASRNSTVHFTLCYRTIFVTTLHESRRKHSLDCWGGVFTEPLSSNGFPIAARVGLRGNVLPSRYLAMYIHVTIFNFVNITSFCNFRSEQMVGRLMFLPTRYYRDSSYSPWSNNFLHQAQVICFRHTANVITRLHENMKKEAYIFVQALIMLKWLCKEDGTYAYKKHKNVYKYKTDIWMKFVKTVHGN
jgi:hypothetical protein